jgi:hypothetical protein
VKAFATTTDVQTLADYPAGDVLSRLIAASEALDCGDVGEARAILGDLERELSRLLGVGGRPFACRSCTMTFRFPGAREDHERTAHPPELTQAEREEGRAGIAALYARLGRAA